MKKYYFVWIPILVLSIMYLIGSFAAMDFNPNNWDPYGRGFLAAMGTLISLALVCAKNDGKL